MLFNQSQLLKTRPVTHHEDFADRKPIKWLKIRLKSKLDIDKNIVMYYNKDKYITRCKSCQS